MAGHGNGAARAPREQPRGAAFFDLDKTLMAGSSVPGTWRHPPADVDRGARLTEIVALSYGATGRGRRR